MRGGRGGGGQEVEWEEARADGCEGHDDRSYCTCTPGCLLREGLWVGETIRRAVVDWSGWDDVCGWWSTTGGRTV